MTDEAKNESAPEKKKGLLSRFKDRLEQLDSDLKKRADDQANSCCDGDDKGGGGRCC